MSGTSLDGVDIACCTFTKNQQWQFRIDKAETIRYSASWKNKLKEAHLNSAEELAALDADYGKLLGTSCTTFITKNKIKGVNFIASHGHTIFHQPQKGFTTQIGNGNAIHAVTGFPVISDFRSLDVAAGGQGAPLVPVGDKLLFNEYDVCLNLGGIANLSFDQKGKRMAYDVCVANMALNYLAAKAGKEYDRNGNMASNGVVNLPMLNQLNSVYRKIKLKRPSLGREFFEKHLQQILNGDSISINDRLCTVVESIAQEITEALRTTGKKKPTVLCTGGGAFNAFLLYRLIEQCGDDSTLIIPDEDVLKFKEALVFAFLGVLRVRNEVNCLKSVTGAARDTSGGVSIGF